MSGGSEDVVGLTARSLVGPDAIPLSGLVAEADRLRVVQTWERALVDGDPIRMSYSLQSAGGATVRVVENSRVLTSPDGSNELIGVISPLPVLRDQPSLDIVEQALEGRRVGVFAIEGDRFSHVSAGASTLLSMSPEEILSATNYLEVFSASSREPLVEAVETLRVTAREPEPLTARTRQGDRGTREVELHLWAIGERAVGGLMVDVTERNRAGRTRRLDRNVEAVTRLAASAAHDFNNVLGAIKATVDAITAEEGDGLEYREDFEHILRAIDRGTALSSQLKELSAPRPQSTDGVHPGTVVRDVVATLEPQVAQRATLYAHVDETAPMVIVNQYELWQAVTNLVINAHDAVDEGGSITVSCFADSDENGLPQAVIQVIDDGSGVSVKDAKRVFEPYFTTKRDGTGLGLHNVWRTVTGAGGSIDVASELGIGSTFSIRMPGVAIGGEKGRAE